MSKNSYDSQPNYITITPQSIRTKGNPPIRLQPSGNTTIEDRVSSALFSCRYPGGFQRMPIRIQPSGSLPSLSE
eukprot:42624-Amphidinium_carterae.1